MEQVASLAFLENLWILRIDGLDGQKEGSATAQALPLALRYFIPQYVPIFVPLQCG